VELKPQTEDINSRENLSRRRLGGGGRRKERKKEKKKSDPKSERGSLKEERSVTLRALTLPSISIAQDGEYKTIKLSQRVSQIGDA
jgi:hypothetical protein